MKFTEKGGNGRDKIVFGLEFSAKRCMDFFPYVCVFHFMHSRINNITVTVRAMWMRSHGLLENNSDRLFAYSGKRGHGIVIKLEWLLLTQLCLCANNRALNTFIHIWYGHIFSWNTSCWMSLHFENYWNAWKKCL